MLIITKTAGASRNGTVRACLKWKWSCSRMYHTTSMSETTWCLGATQK